MQKIIKVIRSVLKIILKTSLPPSKIMMINLTIRSSIIPKFIKIKKTRMRTIQAVLLRMAS